MKQSNSSVYLKIAGFTFRLVFHPTDWPSTRHHLIKEVEFSLGGFIVKKTYIHVDATVHFIDRLGMDVLSEKKSNKHFINFYENKGKNTAISFYHIGIVQLIIIIRTILQNLLAENKGFIFHGSAVYIDDQAHIFLGKSGAGKSTILRLLAEKCLPLADDTLIIKKEKNNYFLYQAPMIDKQAWVGKSVRRYKMGKLFFLHKDMNYRSKKIKDKQLVLKKLIRVFFTDSGHTGKQMKYLLDFIDKNDTFFDLHSGLDRQKLWDLFLKGNQHLLQASGSQKPGQ
ncbi:MAG: hypothetical protein UV73_C0002G0123 [Candidatus Gottesmanbacteria bacterium GW2011_GWA2_43_14]|uniref:Uncharacterized protein n=1 Tax=Candidatus Gottesmanbacteria bacterium GW2011_GWA2_43_14 TaxID=1618443 RepID=A0A0G1DL74_9BACT|nr:MAG: hypothetical protein UV73_C0002G0123 [Candidatus Gottesmanbacteria bacterium GW2011_GWA2_43_14]